MAKVALKASRVNLSLLKRLVSELETTLISVDELKPVAEENATNEAIVELSKAVGIADGIVQEASLLMMDIKVVVRSHSSGSLTKNDLLEKILGPLKDGSSN